MTLLKYSLSICITRILRAHNSCKCLKWAFPSPSYSIPSLGESLTGGKWFVHNTTHHVPYFCRFKLSPYVTSTIAHWLEKARSLLPAEWGGQFQMTWTLLSGRSQGLDLPKVPASPYSNSADFLKFISLLTTPHLKSLELKEEMA